MNHPKPARRAIPMMTPMPIPVVCPRERDEGVEVHEVEGDEVLIAVTGLPGRRVVVIAAAQKS
jgi:hypothetical protein